MSNSANKINFQNSNESKRKEKTLVVRHLELVFSLQIVVIEKRMKVDEKYVQK